MKTVKTAYIVGVTEHERGWGRSHYGYLFFSTPERANEFIRTETAGRSIKDAPDYYQSYGTPMLVVLPDDGVLADEIVVREKQGGRPVFKDRITIDEVTRQIKVK